MDDPRNRLKVVDEFGTDLDRARGTVLRPPSAVSSFGGLRTPAPCVRRHHHGGRHPKPFTGTDFDGLRQSASSLAYGPIDNRLVNIHPPVYVAARPRHFAKANRSVALPPSRSSS